MIQYKRKSTQKHKRCYIGICKCEQLTSLNWSHASVSLQYVSTLRANVFFAFLLVSSVLLVYRQLVSEIVTAKELLFALGSIFGQIVLRERQSLTIVIES